MNNKRWTKQNDEKLVALWGNPVLTITDMASAIGFSAGKVGKCARVLRLPQRPSQKITFDPTCLAALWADQDQAIPDIAHHLEVTVRTVQRVALIMGLQTRPDQYPCEIDLPVLKEMWFDKTITVDAIAIHFGVAHTTIYTALQRAGIPMRGDLGWPVPGRTTPVPPPSGVDAARKLTGSRSGAKRPRAVAKPVDDTPLNKVEEQILASEGRYAALADIAADLGLRLALVQQRYHQLRAAA